MDEDRERFLAAVEGCCGYSWIIIVDMLHIHTISFPFLPVPLFSLRLFI